MNQKPFLKTISAILVFTFSWSNLLFAADPRQMLLDAKAGFDLEDQRRIGGVPESQFSQSGPNQSAVDQQNNLSDLQNLNFSLTTQNGDILRYVGDKLNQVQRPDGTTLRNITLAQDGSIQNADLRLSDGSVQIFQNGHVLGYQTPDGTQVVYENGQIKKTISKDGMETIYSLIKDVQGNVISTILENDGFKTTYDAQGRLKEVFEKSTGRRTAYDGGILQSITDPFGAALSFKSQEIEGRIRVVLDMLSGPTFDTNTWALPDGSILQNIVWDAEGVAQNATLHDADSNVYHFSARKLDSIQVPGGMLTNFTWNAGSLDTAILTDASANRWEYAAGAITRVTLPDGSVLKNLVWDSQNHSQDGVLADAQGNVWTFTAGTVANVRFSDGSLLENIVWSGSSVQDCLLTDAQGRKFTFTGGVIAKILLIDGSLLQNITWDAQSKVKDALLTDAAGCQWTWTNGAVVSVKLPDGSILTGLTWAADGKIQNALLTDTLGNKYTYTAGALVSITAPDNSILTNIVWAADSSLKSGDLKDISNNIFTFVDGYPSKVKLANNTLLENVVWDAQGSFKDGYYTDLSGNGWTFAGGQPVSVRYPDGSVMSSIIWNTTTNKIWGGTLLADGAIYVYPGNGSSLPTQIQLADGTILTAISWSQTNTVLGTNIALPTGEIISLSNGAVTQVTLKDGSIVKNIVFDANGSISSALITGQGNEYTVANGQVTQIKLFAGQILTGIVWNGATLDSALATDSQNRKFYYQSGQLVKIVLSDGAVLTQPVCDSSNVLKGAVLQDSSNTQWTYVNGAVTRIDLADGSFALNPTFNTSTGALYNAVIQDIYGNQHTFSGGSLTLITMPDGSKLTSVVWDNAGKLSSGLWTDTKGVQFTFSGGAVSQIKLTDGSIFTSLVWGSDGRLSGGLLTASNGTKYSYGNYMLVQSTTSTGVITSYTYPTPDTIRVSSGGTSYDYLLSDKTLLKVVRGDGTSSFFNTEGPYKGLRSQDIVGSVTSVYEYQTSGTTVTAQRRDILTGSQLTGFYSGALEKVSFKFNSQAPNNALAFTAVQTKSGNVTRTLTFVYSSGVWTVTRSDYDSTTLKTTNFVSTFNQVLNSTDSYVAELRMEGAKANLYVYFQGQTRSSAEAFTDAFGVTTKISANVANAVYTTQNQGNLQAPAVSTLSATPLTAYADTLKNLTFTKPVATATRKSVLALHTLNFYVPVVNLVSAKNLTNIKKPNLTVTRKFYSQLTKPSVTIIRKTTTALAKITNLVRTSFDFTRPVIVIQKQVMSITKPIFTVTPKVLSLHRMASPDWISFESLFYDLEGRLLQIRQKDGAVLDFQDGILMRASDADGNLTDFVFSQSGLGNILGTRLSQSDVTSAYDEKGSLLSIKVGDTTIYYKKGSQSIDFILKDDGTEIHDIVFDENGNIVSSTIVTTNGDQRFYEDGHLKKVIRGDESELDFDYDAQTLKDTLSKLTTAAKISYNFDYSPDTINAAIDESFIPAAEDITRMEYDTSFNLKKIVRQNQQIIEYAQDQRIAKVSAPSQFAQVFGYSADGSYTITQGNAQSFYDNTNHLLKTIIYPDAQNLHKLEVIYQYDKIRQIKKDGVLTFVYAYSFDTDGKESTQIKDLEEKTSKIYKDSLLLTSLDEDMSVLSCYTYDSQSRVSKVEVTRFSKTLHTYQYAYSGNNTVVTDEEGVVRTYNQNQKLVFLEKDHEKRAYSYSSGADGEEIAQETFVQRTLSDGSTVFYDGAKASNIQKIQLVDGSVITDVILNSDNTFQQAVITLASGTKQVFANNSILEETLPDGTHFYFQNNQISKVFDPQGRELDYSYDRDANGHLTQIWIRTGNAMLRYDAQENLLGLKLDGILTPAEVFAQTQHVYLGGAPGLSFDGDFSTWQYDSGRHYSGGIGDVSSIHNFSQAQTVTSITFDMYAYGAANGQYTQDYEAYYDVQIYRNNQWEIVPGSFGGTYKIQGGGSFTANSGIVTLNNLNLSGVTAVKAVAHGYSNSSGNSGASSAAAAIYEIQYLLADQANLLFSVNKNQSNQITGYCLNGYPGQINFDAQGTLLSGTPSNLSAPAQSLNGAMSFLADKPYFQKINAPALPYSYASAALGAIIDSSASLSQEYASLTGELQTQTKADHTVTLFESNKPSKVTNQAGEVLIEYSYDADGNIQKVSLKNARETLPKEILKAQQSIEEQRLSALKQLAVQKNLTTQSIDNQVNPQRESLLSQLNSLQSQLNDISGIKASGKKAKNQKGDALNQIGGAMDQVRQALAQLDDQASDAYTQLDTQVKALSDQIEADSQTAMTALAAQQSNLQKEIIRQEISPVIYDYYRRILGRDPSSAEYEYWMSKVDYSTGDVEVQKSWIEEVNKSGSMALDGSGDYLEIADSPDWNFGASDFTVDTWFNTSTAAPQWQVIATHAQDMNNRWFLCLERATTGTTQRLAFVLVIGGVVSVSSYHPTYVTKDAWHHAAVVRSGNTFSVYLDGVKGATNPVKAVSLPDFAGSLKIGCNVIPSDWNFYGAIEDMRITVGTALWTANFTPPTVYVADANTKLLIKSNGTALADFSSAQRSLIANGDTRLDKSFYKNEDKTYITHVAVYDKAAKVLKAYLESLPELSARQTYAQNVKNKIISDINAFLLKSDTDKQSFIQSLGLASSDLTPLSSGDVQKILTWLQTRSLHFGQSAFLSLESLLDQKEISYAREDIAEKSILIDILTGVISPLDDGDLVISVFALNKVAQSYGVNLSGTNLNWDDLKSIYDANSAIIEDVTTTSTVPGSSVNFNGSTGYLSTPTSDDWNFGTGDWTVEGWFNWSNVQNSTILNRGPNDFSVSYYNNALYISHPALDTIIRAFTPTVGTWYHIAFERAGGFERIYINGVKQGADVANTHNIVFSDAVYIGSYQGISNFFPGRMDGLKVSKGIARYSQSFTPSAQRTAADSYTKLLLYSDPQTGIKDLSSAPHAMTASGVVSVDTSVYAQTTTQTTTKKVITRYPSSVGNPANLTEAQKQDIISHPENYNPKIVAHINGNHYVVITGVSQDSITYMDPGAGPDKNNQIKTISKATFLKGWKGNVTGDTTLLNLVVTASAQKPTPTARLLNKDEIQKIRGAFFFFLIPLFISFAAGIGGAVTAVLASIETIIASVGTVVAGALSAAGGFLTTAAQGIGYIGSAIWQGISFAASSLFGALGNAGTFLSQNLFGSLAKASFGSNLFSTAVKIGINYAVSKGLETLGVNPIISNLAAAFVTGGITFKSALPNISAATNFFQGGIQGLALQGSQTLLQKVGLDSNLSSVLSLAAAGFTNGILNNNLAGQLTGIGQNLASSLSFYGVGKLGASLGVDPRLSTLIGTPISSAIGANYQPGADAGLTAITAVENGLLSGAVSLGVEYATQNIDPLLGSLTANTITGAISGALHGGDIFGGIYKNFSDSVLSFSSLGIAGTDSWSQAQYLQRVINFSTVIQQKGLAQALEDTATQVMSENAINSILTTINPITGQLFKSVNEFLGYKINNGIEIVTRNGVNFKKISVPNSTDYQLFTADGKTLVEIRKGNKILTGTFGADQTAESFGLTSGTISTYDSGDKLVVRQSIQNGLVVEDVRYSIDPLSGKEILSSIAMPTKGKLGVTFDEFGNYRDADIQMNELGYSFSIKDGSAQEVIDKHFFSRQSSDSLFMLGGTTLAAALGLENIPSSYLGNIYYKLEKEGDGYHSYLGVTDIDLDATSSLETLLAVQKAIDYFQSYGSKNTLRANPDANNLLYIRTGKNSYSLWDPKMTSSSSTFKADIFQNGLRFWGDLDTQEFRAQKDYVVSGGIDYRLDSGSVISVSVSNGMPTYFYYDNSSPTAVFSGTRDASNLLIEGTLTLNNLNAIEFKGGRAVGWHLIDGNTSVRPLTYDWTVDLLSAAIQQKNVSAQNGIFNGGYGAPEDFANSVSEIVNKYNMDHPNSTLSDPTIIPMFTGSIFQKEWLDALQGGNAFYSALLDPINSADLVKWFSTVRDPLAVATNGFFGQLTQDLSQKYFATHPDTNMMYYGDNQILESGSKTSTIDFINKESIRAYSVTMISGNMSDKIRDPYVKLVANFTSTWEYPVSVQSVYKKEDIFANPTEAKQVFNIQFDDKSYNDLIGENKYSHVSYFRNEKNPFYRTSINLNADIQNAVNDGGAAFIQRLVRLKGLSNQADLNKYVADNNGLIKITLDDIKRG